MLYPSILYCTSAPVQPCCVIQQGHTALILIFKLY